MLLSFRAVWTSLVTIAAVSIATPALAVGFDSFGCITNNDAGDCTTGTTQLSAEIVQSGADAVLTIVMTGTDPAVVEQLSIESSLISGVTFAGSGGVGDVDFEANGSAGGNLPGGTNVGFNEAFTIMTGMNPPPRYGIGWHNQDQTSGQSADFLITFNGGDFGAFLAGLRIGVHVTGYPQDGSESFVSTPIPEPSTLALMIVGLAVAAAPRSRR